MMITVSMTESTNTGVAVIMAMSVSMMTEVVVVRMDWDCYWNWSIDMHWNVFLVVDWVWLWNLNWNGHRAFNWYSYWTINWNLCTKSHFNIFVQQYEVYVKYGLMGFENIRGPGSVLVSQRQLGMVFRHELRMVGARELGTGDRLEPIRRLQLKLIKKKFVL